MLDKILTYAQNHIGLCFLILFASIIALRYLLPITIFIIVSACGILALSVMALINYFSQKTKP